LPLKLLSDSIYIGMIGISSGVGKSSLAATLSMALANMGKKVTVFRALCFECLLNTFKTEYIELYLRAQKNAYVSITIHL